MPSKRGSVWIRRNRETSVVIVGVAFDVLMIEAENILGMEDRTMDDVDVFIHNNPQKYCFYIRIQIMIFAIWTC